MSNDFMNEAMSVSKQLRASDFDLEVDPFRDELAMNGAIEAWLSDEGIQPWGENYNSDENGVDFWYLNVPLRFSWVKSMNFPESLTAKVWTPLIVCSRDQAVQVLEVIAEITLRVLPYFSLEITSDEDHNIFIVSSSVLLPAEPKNMQLAIGVAVNDMIPFRESIIKQFMERVPSAKDLTGYPR